MTLFTAYPTYSPYRTLRDVTPGAPAMEGEDVYALQCAINEVLGLSYEDGSALKTDGACADRTGQKIWRIQKKLGVGEDGLAGEESFTALVLYLLGKILPPWSTRYLLVQGILLKEAGCWRIGDYSAQRPPRPGERLAVPGGNFDAGITQQNSEHHSLAEAFNPVQAIPKLVANTVASLERYHNRNLFRGSDHSRRRKLSLAAGSWNAPYFANYLAGVKPDAIPGTAALMALEDYMARATILLDTRP